jgi:hypothetical protein
MIDYPTYVEKTVKQEILDWLSSSGKSFDTFEEAVKAYWAEILG